ncbi:D-alanyl-D-alanine carboxypeptidase [Luteolibacter sp. GHJ8]|jgi:D-alanyl-D-alanine carboxypeptidase (penicillin-binding protein 5/6)|uniref:D-alanyl-D-alanine carboxypeptidase n=1 Tax=Luteolibacter rhizosphaerae TaxID=2989719 RepID=A0ABT3G1W6_9BACT|nr:D-alanyl-D-alanine carboxypeptidase family protein [Luteolibacter rhizosphaerae]MCW1913818.1 D-alanyl-D-alanine carboxypeptidase [Luteolibacter rhizosphaerae]
MFRRASLRAIALLALFSLLPACGVDTPPPRRATPAVPYDEPVRTATIPLTAPPPVAAESAIVIEPISGKVLFAKNADAHRPIASTQKLLTALVVMDSGNIDKPVTITQDDANCEPTKLYLKPGEVHSRRDLLRVLMVKSANDVGRALARDVGGSQEGFADMMNRKAASLGMRNSHFCNPHGLPDPNQFSTARDIAIASRAAWRSQTIRSFTATKAMTFRHNDGRVKTLENTNKLLKRVPYCDGLKTGTTNLAGRCLVSSGTLNGRSAIVVVLKSNSANVWNDSEKLLRWALERPAAQ